MQVFGSPASSPRGSSTQYPRALSPLDSTVRFDWYPQKMKEFDHCNAEPDPC